MTTAITLWSIGHGSRSLDDFLALLAETGIRCLVDVRAWPASRRYPHFTRAALERALVAVGVRHVWEGRALGGRRTPERTSAHFALKDPQFRAYADHMMTATFCEALERLIRHGGEQPTAFMCAERLPSECHRRLISDALVVRGIAVRHVVTAGGAQPHVLNARARRTASGLVYDAGAQLCLTVRDG